MVRLSRMRAYAGGMSSCAPSPPTALLGARLLCAARSATPRSLHRDVPLARSRSIAALVAQPSFPSGTGILAGRCWIVRGGAASSRVPPGRQSGSLAWARRFCGSSPGPGYPRCEGFWTSGGSGFPPETACCPWRSRLTAPGRGVAPGRHCAGRERPSPVTKAEISARPERPNACRAEAVASHPVAWNWPIRRNVGVDRSGRWG